MGDALPFGRPMSARSVRVNGDSQRAMLGAVRVADRVRMVRFLEQLDDASVRAVWRRCVERKSLAPAPRSRLRR